MNTEGKVNNTEDKVNTKAKRTKSSAMKNFTFVSLIIAFAIFAYVGLSPKPEPIKAIKEDIPAELSSIDVLRLIDEKQAKYLKKNRQALESFRAALETAGADKFRNAKNGIDGAVSDLTGLAVTAKLCWKMAKDQLRDTKDTDEAIGSVIGPKIIQPCQEGRMQIDDALQNFRLRIQENRNQYYADLITAAKRVKPNRVPILNQKMSEDYGKIKNQFEGLVIDKTLFGAGVALDLAFIKSTCSVLRTVCGHIVAKLTSSATTACILPVADGPLPVGDAIAAVIFVGGAAWSAYDIYKVTCVLPGEIRTSLETTVQNAETTARTEAWKHAESMIRQCEKESLETVGNFKKELN